MPFGIQVKGWSAVLPDGARTPRRIGRPGLALAIVISAAELVAIAVCCSLAPVGTVLDSWRSGGDGLGRDIRGRVDLFDRHRPHSLRLRYAQADYLKMIDAYRTRGEKVWIAADLVIDQTTVPRVGLRLKGNSSLMGLGEAASSGRAHQPGPDLGAAVGEGDLSGQRDPVRPGMLVGMTAMGVHLSADEPEDLPWLISFDEYHKGRRYQGHQAIALRSPGGVLALNEAVALSLLTGSGQSPQHFGYTSFVVDGRPARARLLVEEAGARFARALGPSGRLYKALLPGQFRDQGSDPSAYRDDFKQINRTDDRDLQPVVDLVRWVEGASAEEFADDLGQRLDVAAFARYVATQNLLTNFDDMAGPGRNYYLWYDLIGRRFTVIASDLNLVFTGRVDQDPHDPMRSAGAVGHPLKDRFLATAAFVPVYEAAYRQLYREWFASGAAIAALEANAAEVGKTAGADQTAARSEAAVVRGAIEGRIRNLATSQIIAGNP